MSDDPNSIVNRKPTRILSLEEARTAMGQKDADLIGPAGMKRNADKEFVLTTSLTVATGVAERVYDLMSEQQAEGLAKCEAMCLQHVEQLRAELEQRSFMGRLRRFGAWLAGLAERVTRAQMEAERGWMWEPETTEDKVREALKKPRVPTPPMCPVCGPGPEHMSAREDEEIVYKACAAHRDMVTPR